LFSGKSGSGRRKHKAVRNRRKATRKGGVKENYEPSCRAEQIGIEKRRGRM